MERTFTPLLTFNDLRSYNTDLFSDAFGIDAELEGILPSLEYIKGDPSDDVLSGLFEMISHDTTVR